MSDFRSQLRAHLEEEDVVNFEELEAWMIKYHIKLKGSLILQVLYNTVWENSDIDFNFCSELDQVKESTEEVIEEKIEQVMKEKIKEATRLAVLQKIFRLSTDQVEVRQLGELGESTQTVKLTLVTCTLTSGKHVDIGCCDDWWRRFVYPENWSFCQNAWHPQTGLTINYPLAVREKSCMVDVYSELVTRVSCGYHPYRAMMNILARIAKYRERGFVVEY